MSVPCKQPMDLEAALAVIDWKHEFARQLGLQALQMAGENERSVTVSQLRSALPSAIQAMLTVILSDPQGHADGESKAA